MDKTLRDIELTDGVGAVIEERFDRWAKRWRTLHPEDTRTDLELIGRYAYALIQEEL